MWHLTVCWWCSGWWCPPDPSVGNLPSSAVCLSNISLGVAVADSPSGPTSWGSAHGCPGTQPPRAGVQQQGSVLQHPSKETSKVCERHYALGSFLTSLFRVCWEMFPYESLAFLRSWAEVMTAFVLTILSRVFRSKHLQT